MSQAMCLCMELSYCIDTRSVNVTGYVLVNGIVILY